MIVLNLLTCNCRKQQHKHHDTQQVALEYPWVFANITMANNDGVEIAHIQTERVASLEADNFS